MGNGFTLAATGGTESITLNTNQIPAHGHPFLGSTSAANNANPGGNVVAQASTFFPYLNAPPTTAMAAQGGAASTGGSQPHENCQPYLCIDFIISLFGIFPSQT
jgi:microcystin-dependent protein